MIKLNLKWREKKGQYQTGEFLYLNRIELGSYYWNSFRSRGSDEPAWAGALGLPSLKTKMVYGNSTDEIKTKLVTIVTRWFDEALLDSD